MINFNEKINLIWQIAESLRGVYKPEKYGIMLMRRRTYSDEFKSTYAFCPEFDEQKQSKLKLKQAKEPLISQTITGKIEIL